VCVVGGGISGTSVALHLAEAGIQVVVLEARRLGWGATGRSAGQLLTGFLPGPADMVRILGAEHTRQLHRLAHLGKEMLKRRLHTLPSCDFRPGYISAGLGPKHCSALESVPRYWLQCLDITGALYLSSKELSAHVRSPLYQCGLFDPTGGSLDPLKLLHGLATTVAKRGGLIFEKSPALKIAKLTHGQLVIETDAGSVVANHVILCGNAYLDRLYPGARAYIMPVRSGGILTQPLDADVIDSMLPKRTAGSDWRFDADFWSVTADDRLLFGAGGVHLKRALCGSKHAIAARLTTVFPQLSKAKIERCWEGSVAQTRNGLPQIGRLEENVWVAHGYNGIGLAMGFLAGMMIANAVCGQQHLIAAFESIKHNPFPYGWSGLPTRAWINLIAWARDHS
jgi:gamma-glutamylputrescine oxidase